MSDPRMSGGMPGGMPSAPAPTGATGATGAPKNLSPMNGADRAYMQSRGQDENMTIKDMVEKTYGLPITAPVSALKAKIGQMMKGRTAMGKAKQMGAQPSMPSQGAQSPMGAQASPQAPSAAPQSPSGSGLGSLMNKIQ